MTSKLNRDFIGAQLISAVSTHYIWADSSAPVNRTQGAFNVLETIKSIMTSQKIPAITFEVRGVPIVYAYELQTALIKGSDADVIKCVQSFYLAALGDYQYKKGAEKGTRETLETLEAQSADGFVNPEGSA